MVFFLHIRFAFVIFPFATFVSYNLRLYFNCVFYSTISPYDIKNLIFGPYSVILIEITDYDQLDEIIADIPLHFYHCFYLFLEAGEMQLFINSSKITFLRQKVGWITGNLPMWDIKPFNFNQVKI